MYLEFYGLNEKPFSQTPDPRFLYWNDAYRETLASLSYGVRERKGFIAMLGEAGTGKTTLLRKLLDDLGDDIVSVFLFNPNATFEEILEYTLSELGITAPSGRKLAMLQRLNEFLLAAYSEGRNTILVIDEAQDLDSDVLESLRLLSNLETSEDKILQIVLSGQPELAEKLADPSLRQLKQRISVRRRLEPLQREELPSYLSARLAVAGGSPDLFDPETFPAIWEFSTGIPRIINTVCDNALLLGYALGTRTIDSSVVGEVITDLRKLDVDGWLPTPTPAGTTPPPPPVVQPPFAKPAPAIPAAPPEPRLIHQTQSASPARRPSGSVGWLVAAVLAGLVLLLAGAWLGRSGAESEIRPASTGNDGNGQKSEAAGGLAATSLATAATTSPPVAARVAAPAELSTDDEPTARPAYPKAAPQAPREQAARPATDPQPRVVAPADTARREPAQSPEVIAQVAPTSATEPTAESIPPEAASVAAPENQPSSDESAEPSAPTEAPRLASPKDPLSAAGSAEGNAPAEPARLAFPNDGDAGSTEGTISTAAGSLPVPIRPPSREERAAALPASPAAPADAPTEPKADTRLAVARTPAREPKKRPRTAGRSTRVPVVPGDTLLELAGRRYGSSNLTTLDMLRVVNADIRDVDLIIAGSGIDFPDPGPKSRILPDGSGYTVLAMTTATLSRALAVQASLEDDLGRPVSLERVATRGGASIFRVSVRGLSDRSNAADIANGLGSILEDPTP